MKASRLILYMAALSLFLVCPFHSARADEEDCDGDLIKTDLSALGGSGITGKASLCIEEEGIHARVAMKNVNEGNLFTLWVFYDDDGGGPAPTIGPARVDSAVAEHERIRLRGRLGGLGASSGATIRLVILDHGASFPNNTERARNALTAMVGAPVAVAVFNIS